MQRFSSAGPDVQIDVVVTVRDALEYVALCLESLRRHAEGFALRVIVVNDGSEADTTEWLRELSVSWPELVLLEQTHSQGYTLALNRGLLAAGAAWVVALNSDTVVSEGWLAGMLRCAETDPNIGIVGPLSNAASFQSVPDVFNERGQFAVNQLSDGLDAARMARLVAGAAALRYPRVPALNGFCMLIRRSVLERVGLMDALSFPRGYGEETDYCLRAAALGFSFAVADDVYVFHAKSKSFGDAARVELTKRGARVLVEKHGPDKVRELDDQLRHDVLLQAARERIQDALARYADARRLADSLALRVLFLLPVMGQSGGANSVITEAAELARLGVTVKVAVPEGARSELLALYPEVAGLHELLIAPSLRELAGVSSGFDVVVATAHRTMEWMASVVEANPDVLPAYYVQDYEPWFHPEGSAERDAAAESYVRIPGALLFAKTLWLARTVQAAHGVSVAKVAPSLEHEVFHATGRVRSSRLRVGAMIRPQTPRRGAARVTRVLRELARHYGERVEIKVFGCDSRDPRFLALQCDFPLTNFGVLQRPRVADLLRHCDLFVDLSDHQAFGRTAFEAMACGAVPVVPEAGGAEEFAVDKHNALVVDVADETACVDRIRSVLDAPDELARLRSAGLNTTSRYSLRAAALSELEVLADAARAWRREHPPRARRRLALAYPYRGRAPRDAADGALAGWRKPCVRERWTTIESAELPNPASADVAIVLLGPVAIDWSLLESWLGQWRRSAGRFVAHWDMPVPAPGTSDASVRLDEKQVATLAWLAASADLVAVSTPALVHALAAMGIAAALVPHSDEANGAASSILRELTLAPPRGQPPPLPPRLRGYVLSVFPRWRKLYVAEGAARRFAPPRSRVQRKLDKLRRDPAAFFRDARLAPLRLLKGLFG